MPRFRWKGSDASGNVISGELKSASKENALMSLKATGIQVTSLLEEGESVRSLSAAVQPGVRGKAKGAILVVFALALVGVAGLLSSLQPETIFHCTSAGDNRCNCVIESRIAGFYSLYTLQVPHIDSVTIEEKTQYSLSVNKYNGKEKTTVSSRASTRLALHTNADTFHTEWIGYTLGSSNKAIQGKLTSLRTQTTGAEFTAWQAEAATTLFGVALLILALFMLRSGFKNLLSS